MLITNINRFDPSISTASPAALRQLPLALQHRLGQACAQPRRGIIGGLTNPGGGVPAKKDEGETAVAKPIDFDVSARVEGQETQIVVVRLRLGLKWVHGAALLVPCQSRPFRFTIQKKPPHRTPHYGIDAHRWTWSPGRCSGPTPAPCST